MSEPTYRIDVEHRPQDAPLFGTWYAKVYRVSDESYMTGSGSYGDTSDQAVDRAREWIAAEAQKSSGFSVYTDESGCLVTGHSVKS